MAPPPVGFPVSPDAPQELLCRLRVLLDDGDGHVECCQFGCVPTVLVRLVLQVLRTPLQGGELASDSLVRCDRSHTHQMFPPLLYLPMKQMPGKKWTKWKSSKSGRNRLRPWWFQFTSSASRLRKFIIVALFARSFPSSVGS